MIDDSYIKWEIAKAIRLLEKHNYIIRKPSEADLPSVMEIEGPNSNYQLGVRLDVNINGETLALMQRFPCELILSPDNPNFREQHLPRILSDQLAHAIADKLTSNIIEQIKEKIIPLIPEKRMSLEEIVSFIAEALGTSLHRVDPLHYDEQDKRI